jgi:hypothetical protein
LTLTKRTPLADLQIRAESAAPESEETRIDKRRYEKTTAAARRSE